MAHLHALQQYDWFRSTMKTFLSSEEVSLKSLIDVKAQYEQQLSQSFSDLQQLYTTTIVWGHRTARPLLSRGNTDNL
jgi:hypothetical protein